MKLTDEEVQSIKEAIDAVRKSFEHDGENAIFAKQCMGVIRDLCREGFTREEAVGILKAALISKR